MSCYSVEGIDLEDGRKRQVEKKTEKETPEEVRLIKTLEVSMTDHTPMKKAKVVKKQTAKEKLGKMQSQK